MTSELRRIREDRGLTQVELAAKVRTTKTTISKYELGERQISKEMAMRLGNALNCHWAELWGETLPSPRQQKFLTVLNGLSEADQTAAFRFVDAMAQSSPPDESDGKRAKGSS